MAGRDGRPILTTVDPGPVASVYPAAKDSGSGLAISVCIASHGRPGVLRDRAFEGLASQSRRPHEVVVTDSSDSGEAAAPVAAFGAGWPEIRVRHVRTDRRALPWHRWLGFSRSTGDIILFLDDDIRLEPTALALLEEAYRRRPASPEDEIVGIGFAIFREGSPPPRRDRSEFRERWIGTSRYASGTLGPGGLPAPPDPVGDEPVPVSHLSGGAMSYRREVLEKIGFLDRLVELYDDGIGRAEDVVLSASASRYGELELITRPIAWHPAPSGSRSRPYGTSGWQVGLTQTWTKAHQLRWAAIDFAAYRWSLLRVVSLELARCAASILRRPWRAYGWLRLAGASYGIVRTAWNWRRIPLAPSSAPGRRR